MAPLATPPVSEGRPAEPGEIADDIKTESKPQLRRAVYVNVSDLAQPYNIDPEKLKVEMAKVKSAKEDEKAEQGTSPSTHPKRGNEEMNASMEKLDMNSIDGYGSPRIAAKKGQYHQKLHPPSGGFNLCLLVGKVNVVVDKLRVDRTRVRVAEVEVGDETGTVSLRARDGQIDVLEEISNQKGAAVLRNCTLELYQGRHLRLAITKWGKLRAYPDNIASTPSPPKQINQDLNYSCVDLNLVIGEMKAAEVSPSSSTSDKQRHFSSRNADGRTDDASSTRTSSSNHSRQHQSWRGGNNNYEAKRNQYYYRQNQLAGASYGMPYQEGGVGDQANQILFPPVQSFAPLYSDGSMNVPQYNYPVHPQKRNDEGHQSYYQRHILDYPQRREHQYKQQQHLLLQQYEMQQHEMQQRQMQQMQLFQQQQQERQRQLFDPHSQQQPHQLQSTYIDPDLLRAGSVDSGEYYPVSPGAREHHPTMVPLISSGQVLVPPRAGTMPMMSGSQQSSEKHSQKSQLIQMDAPSAEGHRLSTSAGNESNKRSGSHRGGGISMRHDRARQKQSMDSSSATKTVGSGGHKHRSSGGHIRGVVRGGNTPPSAGNSKQANIDRRKFPKFTGGGYSVQPLTDEQQYVSAHPHERRALNTNLQPSLDVDTSQALGHMNPNATSFDPSYAKNQGEGTNGSLLILIFADCFKSAPSLCEKGLSFRMNNVIILCNACSVPNYFSSVWPQV
mmetsp:Transcript_7598/g.11084  ORF Transcript_7598/g.11084 Transcript_7598/m.11084 type:complete len:726 (-) Transcript_7598:819-2996(-)